MLVLRTTVAQSMSGLDHEGIWTTYVINIQSASQ